MLLEEELKILKIIKLKNRTYPCEIFVVSNRTLLLGRIYIFLDRLKHQGYIKEIKLRQLDKRVLEFYELTNKGLAVLQESLN